MIELTNVEVERNGRSVINGVTLAAASGELVALIGPNGSGKSSLVGAICGDLPHNGEIVVDSIRVDHRQRATLARHPAVVTQDNPVSLGFTVREVVSFGRAPWRGTPLAERDDEFVELALAKMDLHDLCSTCPAASGPGSPCPAPSPSKRPT